MRIHHHAIHCCSLRSIRYILNIKIGIASRMQALVIPQTRSWPRRLLIVCYLGALREGYINSPVHVRDMQWLPNSSSLAGSVNNLERVSCTRRIGYHMLCTLTGSLNLDLVRKRPIQACKVMRSTMIIDIPPYSPTRFVVSGSMVVGSILSIVLQRKCRHR